MESKERTEVADSQRTVLKPDKGYQPGQVSYGGFAICWNYPGEMNILPISRETGFNH